MFPCLNRLILWHARPRLQAQHLRCCGTTPIPVIRGLRTRPTTGPLSMADRCGRMDRHRFLDQAILHRCGFQEGLQALQQKTGRRQRSKQKSGGPCTGPHGRWTLSRRLCLACRPTAARCSKTSRKNASPADSGSRAGNHAMQSCAGAYAPELRIGSAVSAPVKSCVAEKKPVTGSVTCMLRKAAPRTDAGKKMREKQHQVVNLDENVAPCFIHVKC